MVTKGPYPTENNLETNPEYDPEDFSGDSTRPAPKNKPAAQVPFSDDATRPAPKNKPAAKNNPQPNVALPPQPADMPLGYYLESDGSLWKFPITPVTKNGAFKPAIEILECYVSIHNVSIDSTDNISYVTLSWSNKGKQHLYPCERTILASPNKIVSLANHSLPVSSHQAQELCIFISAALRARTVPDGYSGLGGGWFGKGFLLGVEPFGKDCPTRKMDDGLDPLVLSITQLGDSEVWSKTMLAAAQKYPVLRMLLATAAVPPLMTPLNLQAWVVDVNGNTSSGKSTIVKAAISMWADADMYQQEWEATPTFIECLGVALNNLPMFLDDASKLTISESAKTTIYNTVSGVGKGRAKADGGTRKQARYKTILISTNEGKLTNKSKGAGGAERRCISLGMSPWGKKCPKTAKDIEVIDLMRTANYGHAGKAFIEKLVSMTDKEFADVKVRWKIIQQEFSRRILEISSESTADADFMSKCLASTQISGELLGEVLGWPKMDWIDESLFIDISNNLIKVNKPRTALEIALEWLMSNSAQVQYDRPNPKEPIGGFIGRHMDNTYSFVPIHLEKMLMEKNIDADQMIRSWYESGWTNPEPGKKIRRYRYTAGGVAVDYRMITMRRNALKDLFGDTYEALPEPNEVEEPNNKFGFKETNGKIRINGASKDHEETNNELNF